MGAVSLCHAEMVDVWIVLCWHDFNIAASSLSSYMHMHMHMYMHMHMHMHMPCTGLQ